MDRTVGIILTIASTLLCGVCSIFLCAAGILGSVLHGEFTVLDMYGNTQVFTVKPPSIFYLLIAIAVLLILVPIVIGLVTLRSRSTPPAVPPTYPPDQPLPPAI